MLVVIEGFISWNVHIINLITLFQTVCRSDIKCTYRLKLRNWRISIFQLKLWLKD